MKLPRLASLQDLSRMCWVINQDGCGFRRRALKRHFDAAHLPFHVAVEALDFGNFGCRWWRAAWAWAW